MIARAGIALGMALTLSVGAVAQDPVNPFEPFDRAAFETYLRDRGASQAQLDQFAQDVEEGAIGFAADEAMRRLSDPYDKAVTLAEDGEPRAALELTRLLASTRDARLRAHVRYHLGRVFLDADDPDQAVEVFAAYLREDRNQSPLDSEVLYFYGQALVEVPAPALAGQVFRSFLEFFPDAPERYVASATQMIAELEAQVGPLHEIADIMKVCQRRIRKTDTGKDTQKRQEQVISKLEVILEEMIEKEKQSSGAASGLSSPAAPASSSSLPPGATRVGNLKRNSGVADRWGMMKDRDREAIESELRDNLPGHFQRMLEEYYRRLNAGRR